MSPDLKRDLERGRGVKVGPLADALNTSPVTIYSAIKRGEIAATRIKKRIVIAPHVARRLLGLDAA